MFELISMLNITSHAQRALSKQFFSQFRILGILLLIYLQKKSLIYITSLLLRHYGPRLTRCGDWCTASPCQNWFRRNVALIDMVVMILQIHDWTWLTISWSRFLFSTAVYAAGGPRHLDLWRSTNLWFYALTTVIIVFKFFFWKR